MEGFSVDTGIPMDDLHEIFNDSYQRVFSSKHSEAAFFSGFYLRFLKASPAVRDHFKNTDMDQQAGMLKKSFYHVHKLFITRMPTPYMEGIASKHAKGHWNIEPELYEIWLRALLDTVEEFDPKFNPSIEEAWLRVMRFGVEYMKSKYDP